MNILDKRSIKQEQERLKELGYYEGLVDGIWGNMSKQALDLYEQDLITASRVSIPQHPKPSQERQIAWGAVVSPVFKDRILWIESSLEMPEGGADWLMSCIAWESGETFSPSVRNMAGSGATGLIQFMPSTALSLGTTTDKLARMSAEDQLNFVYKYFAPRKGKLNNIGDVYMAILWPLGVGKADSYVLWDKVSRPTTYRQNSGLDVNKDGRITRAEAIDKVIMKLEKGLMTKYKG